jgi:hypothetical protein
MDSNEYMIISRLGLLDDMVKLIREWLINRFLYVDINGANLVLFD